MPKPNRGAVSPLAALAAAALLTACATPGGPTDPAARTAVIQRTAYGVPHISAPDLQTLAYGVSYAYAQDNVCMTADTLVTARGERARWFGGGSTSGLLGRRRLPNEQVDLFIAAHMDDGALAQAWERGASADARAMARGFVDGYNRFLDDHAGKLPAACNDQPWVRPMTLAEYYRMLEVTMVQAGIAALADAMLGAQPPAATAAAPDPSPPGLADAAAAMREAGVLDSPLGSNAWAFGRETTANARGVLLGNPHFPWTGPNRFWGMHLTVPGRLDAMGAGIGHFPIISVGFNKDVAWSNTVSTGKRFTLHELALVAGDPTSYLVDGRPEKMRPRTLEIAVRQPDGVLARKSHTVWSTRWGPLVVVPRAGLNWTATRAYALQDVNSGQARAFDVYLAINRAGSVAAVRDALAGLGTPWVNTIAADRHGDVLYADASSVPDVDGAQLQRCAPSPQAAALRQAAGLVVLDGSKSACDWRRDAASPAPGTTPIERMPVVVRRDWVHNSNDSFVYTHPAQRFDAISPLVGDAQVTRPRTRAGLSEIPEMRSRGNITPQAVQSQLFENRNFIAGVVLPDLLAACAGTPPAATEARDGCAVLRRRLADPLRPCAAGAHAGRPEDGRRDRGGQGVGVAGQRREARARRRLRARCASGPGAARGHQRAADRPARRRRVRRRAEQRRQRRRPGHRPARPAHRLRHQLPADRHLRRPRPPRTGHPDLRPEHGPWLAARDGPDASVRGQAVGDVAVPPRGRGAGARGRGPAADAALRRRRPRRLLRRRPEVCGGRAMAAMMERQQVAAGAQAVARRPMQALCSACTPAPNGDGCDECLRP